MSMSSPGKMGNTVMADINVTPLVDVMLVLLIIFMVTAPMMQQGVKVDLPQATGTQFKAEKEMPSLTITHDGKYYLGKYEIKAEELQAKLSNNERLKREKKLNVYSDRAAPYGIVAVALAAVHKAGIDQVGLVFENLRVQMTKDGPEYVPTGPPEIPEAKGQKQKKH